MSATFHPSMEGQYTTVSDGLFSAAAGLAAQQTRIDVLANDLANVNTTGYRSARLGFRDLVYAQEKEGVRVGSGTAAVDAGRSQIAGALKETGQPLDVAIAGS